MATLKRKHVVFDEPAQDEEPQVQVGGVGEPAAGPSIHPDRLAAVAAAQPAKKPKLPKVKSERKKKYLARKARKQRRMKSAKKAATPKDRVFDGDTEESGSDSGSGSEESGDESEEGEEVVPAAGPSTAVTTGKATVDGLTEAQEAARRKAEKRAKRDARREERKAKRKAERIARKARLQAQAEQGDKGGEEEDEDSGGEDEDNPVPNGKAASGDGSDGEDEDEDETAASDDDGRSIPDLPERHSRSPSPPPLEPFPLPRMAPAPDAGILSRQGMPTGLEDAEFVDQSLRLRVGELPTPLSERTQARLADLGVDDLFAVQAAILPHILSLPLVPLPYTPLHDYLISAPTGSGKTLAYAIPIVELLARRVVPRLRALIVLPTRELVVQVRETLEALAKGTGLVIGSVTGQHSFAHEQAQLVGDSTDPLLGGASRLDVLISTPGRLMDHLASTPNFTLQHLRFLVIDEADRLLTQSFQNWLAQVLAHTRPPTTPAPAPAAPHDAVAPNWAAPLGLASTAFEGSEPVPSTCQKLLFSATLTRDPAKVAALDLTSPRYFIVQSPDTPLSAAAVGSSFALPPELEERSLILPPALKPLNLIHLIHEFNATPALVFTKSVEAATRLVKLLEFFEDAFIGGKRASVRGYTRDMPPAERKRLLAEFAAGSIDVLVCSDLVARGMDLPSVAHVVSYDVPLDMTKYVHRAGRTARAGRAGTAWTLVEKQEALHFKSMLKAAGHAVKKVKVKEEELAAYRESYEIAMKRLREAYGRD